MRAVGAGLPQAAGLRLEKTIAHFRQRVWVGVREERADVVIGDVGIVDGVEMMAGHGAGGGGEGEHVIDGGRHLEGALVAVAAHAIDPFGVDDARAHDAGDFLLQRAHARALGARR
jgi:hypothetical protein